MVRHPHAMDPRGSWSVGAAHFRVKETVQGHRLIICVTCKLDRSGERYSALLDTGAEFSMVGGEIAQELCLAGKPPAQPIEISTRFGRFEGQLQRLAVTLVAEDGDDLEVDASVLLTPRWPGPVVLGYGGMLERVRLGLDPGVTLGNEWILWGAAG